MSETENTGQKIADAVEIGTELAAGVIEDLTTKSETTDEALDAAEGKAETAMDEAEKLRRKGHE